MHFPFTESMKKTISEVDIRGNSFRANEAVKSETKSAD